MDDSTTATGEAESAGRSLDEDSMVAACLSQEDGFDGITTVDLCVVGLDGSRTVIRPSIDPGEGLALSPDRESVAFISSLQLAFVGVDGEDGRSMGVAGHDPEWLDESRIALVDATEGRLLAVDQDGASDDPLVSLESLELPVELTDAVIEDFAVRHSAGDFVLALWSEGDPATQSDDQFGVVATDGAELEILLGPSTMPMHAVDLSPSEELLALSYDNDVIVLHLASGTTTPISPRAWYGVGPTWSPDGQSLAWTGDGAGIEEGPVVFAISSYGSAVGPPEILVGNSDAPKDRFPAFADWGAASADPQP